jgi:hypothetical protein
VAAATLFVVGAGTIVLPRMPQSWTNASYDADQAGFSALYVSLLGIGLLQGSDAARRFVLLVSLLAVPLGALLLFAPQPGVGWFGTTLALLALGLIGLLFRPPASAARAAAFGILAVIAAAAFVPAEILLARAPREAARRQLAEWTAPEARFEDRDLGVSLEPPAEWAILKRGNPYVAIPDPTLALAHWELSARAALELERDVRDVVALRTYEERYLERRSEHQPTLISEPGLETTVGDVPARRLSLTWTDDDVEYWGQVVLWRDQSRFFVWTTWCPAEDAEARSAIESLEKGLTITQPLAKAAAAAVMVISAEMPEFSKQTVEALLRHRETLAGSPPALTFREALYAASRGLQLVPREQVSDLAEVNGALYQLLPPAERARLSNYMDRVRAFDATVTAEDDEWAMRAVRGAFERLAEAKRTRLREILDTSALAALRD